MSTIGVKFHNEDIHNILQKPLPSAAKPPRYDPKQILLKKAELTAKYKYNGHQTFGMAHYDPPETWNYLKKGKARTQLPQVKKSLTSAPKRQIKPPLPKTSPEKPKYVPKNFVKENIKMVASLEPKVPAPRRVETPRGTVKDMTHLLQMIKIRDSDRYGKIPKYLCTRKQQWERAEERRQRQKEALKKYKEKMGIGTMGMKENVYILNIELRHKLLHGLKENWNELSKQFLKLPVMNDTLTKIRRRAWLEKEMDQIEKDIKLIESHPYIYLEKSENKTWEQILQEETESENVDEDITKKDENELKGQATKEKEENGEIKSKKSLEQEVAVATEEVEEKKEVKEEEVQEKKEKNEDEDVKITNY